jgi:hypothetical protein
VLSVVDREGRFGPWTATTVEIDTELAKLDASGYRPLRSFERDVVPSR